jgi:hypothetical protein
VPHVALLGPPDLLDRCAPVGVEGLDVTRIDGLPTAEAVAAKQPDALVAFEPSADELTALGEARLPALVWWRDVPPSWASGSLGATASEATRTVTGAAGTSFGAWRSVPLPVSDELFADPVAPHDAASADAAIAVNFQDGDGPPSMDRALVALARTQLLISAPLAPSRGIEAGIDYVEVRNIGEVRSAKANAVRAPAAFERMRLHGRRKAELFRSSQVLSRLVGDLLFDLDRV